MASVGDTITDGTVTWEVKDTRSVASTVEAGLMSAADKKKLDELGSISRADIPIAGNTASLAGAVFIPKNKGLVLDSTTGQVTLAAATKSSIGGVKPGIGLAVKSGALNITDTILNTKSNDANGNIWIVE